VNLIESLKKIYRKLPTLLQLSLKPFTILLDENYPRNRWIKKYYGKVTQWDKESIFIYLARFMQINRPPQKYYMEFGCHSGATTRYAWKHFRWLFDLTYIAFDSFEGLPDIPEFDRQEIWEKGKLKTEEGEFVQIVTKKDGIPRDKLITVKGFYEDSLTEELKFKFLPGKAAVIYVDCDLYSSTVPVLEFCKDFLAVGTVITFDDWNCFNADPKRGERLAFSEFLDKHPQFQFEELLATSEGKAFVCVNVV
jgi:O-methyltransferase